MKHLGMGVMINALLGQNGAELLEAALGKEITKAGLDPDDDAFLMRFADGTGVRLKDDGQSCCEHRYMVCDDDPNRLVGGTLQKVEVVDGPDGEDDEWGNVHEIQFLNITASTGMIQLATHNEHNGYYGGFSIRVFDLPH